MERMLNKKDGKDGKQEILKRRMLNKKYRWIDQQDMDRQKRR